MRRALASFGLFALLGCGRSCDDHPYVPYAVGDGAPIDAGIALDAAPPNAASDSGAASLTRAPEDATTWDLFGATLTAPPDEVFAFATALGEGTARDVIAITQPKDAPGPLRVLAFRLEGAQAPSPRVLFVTKQAVLDASCSPEASLATLSSQAASLSLSFACAGHSAPPPRSVALLLSRPTGAIARVAAEIRDREGDPSLDARIDVSDRDHDGVPDATFVFEVDGATANVVLFDRPAGLSRDPSEPEASLAVLEREAERRLEARDTKGALGAEKSLRALYRAICQTPSPRITPLLGATSFSCNANAVLRKAQVTDARALAREGERLRSLFELDVAARLGEKVDPKVLAPDVTFVAVKEKRAFDRALQAPSRGTPSYSALAFDAAGTLFARADGGALVQLDPPAQEGAGDAGDAWALGIASPDGAERLIDAYDPCDQASVRLMFAGASSTEDVSIGVEPLLGRKCEGTRGGAVAMTPVAWTQSGLALLVFGQYVQIARDWEVAHPAWPADFAASKGSGAAAKGALVALKTPFGVAIDDGKHAKILRDADKKPVDGTACVVSNDGTRVACILHTTERDTAVLYLL